MVPHPAPRATRCAPSAFAVKADTNPGSQQTPGPDALVGFTGLIHAALLGRLLAPADGPRAHAPPTGPCRGGQPAQDATASDLEDRDDRQRGPGGPRYAASSSMSAGKPPDPPGTAAAEAGVPGGRKLPNPALEAPGGLRAGPATGRAAGGSQPHGRAFCGTGRGPARATRKAEVTPMSVSRPGAQDGGPTPSPRAGVLPATRRGATRSIRPSTCTASSSTATASWSRPASTTCSRRSAKPSTGSFTATTGSARCCSIPTSATTSAGPAAVDRARGAAARGPVRPGELDAGRPEGPLRADGRAARRAEPVRRAVSEQDEVRRRAGRGDVADAVGAAGLPRTPRGGTPRRPARRAARLRAGGAAAAHPP